MTPNVFGGDVLGSTEFGAIVLLLVVPLVVAVLAGLGALAARRMRVPSPFWISAIGALGVLALTVVAAAKMFSLPRADRFLAFATDLSLPGLSERFTLGFALDTIGLGLAGVASLALVALHAAWRRKELTAWSWLRINAMATLVFGSIAATALPTLAVGAGLLGLLAATLVPSDGRKGRAAAASAWAVAAFWLWLIGAAVLSAGLGGRYTEDGYEPRPSRVVLTDVGEGGAGIALRHQGDRPAEASVVEVWIGATFEARSVHNQLALKDATGSFPVREACAHQPGPFGWPWAAFLALAFGLGAAALLASTTAAWTPRAPRDGEGRGAFAFAALGGALVACAGLLRTAGAILGDRSGAVALGAVGLGGALLLAPRFAHGPTAARAADALAGLRAALITVPLEELGRGALIVERALFSPLDRAGAALTQRLRGGARALTIASVALAAIVAASGDGAQAQLTVLPTPTPAATPTPASPVPTERGPALSLEPGTLLFARPGQSALVRISNPGAEPIALRDVQVITWNNVPSDDFVVDALTSRTLASGESAQARVSWKPARADASSFGALVVRSASAGESPSIPPRWAASVALRGGGATGGPSLPSLLVLWPWLVALLIVAVPPIRRRADLAGAVACSGTVALIAAIVIRFDPHHDPASGGFGFQMLDRLVLVGAWGWQWQAGVDGFSLPLLLAAGMGALVAQITPGGLSGANGAVPTASGRSSSVALTLALLGAVLGAIVTLDAAALVVFLQVALLSLVALFMRDRRAAVGRTAGVALVASQLSLAALVLAVRAHAAALGPTILVNGAPSALSYDLLRWSVSAVPASDGWFVLAALALAFAGLVGLPPWGRWLTAAARHAPSAAVPVFIVAGLIPAAAGALGRGGGAAWLDPTMTAARAPLAVVALVLGGWCALGAAAQADRADRLMRVFGATLALYLYALTTSGRSGGASLALAPAAAAMVFAMAAPDAPSAPSATPRSSWQRLLLAAMVGMPPGVCALSRAGADTASALVVAAICVLAAAATCAAPQAQGMEEPRSAPGA